MQTRVLPLISPEGVHVDVILGMLLFEELAIQRAVIQPVAPRRCGRGCGSGSRAGEGARLPAMLAFDSTTGPSPGRTGRHRGCVPRSFPGASRLSREGISTMSSRWLPVCG